MKAYEVFVLIAAGLGADPAAAEPAEGRLFELREYHAAPGKLDALHARFRDHTLRLHERHGITNVAFFTVADPADERLYVLLAYPDAAARRRSWESFVADPEWQRVRRAADADGRLVERIREYPLVPTADSPRVASQLAAAGRVFDFHANPVPPGHTVIGSWTTADGTTPVRLVARDPAADPPDPRVAFFLGPEPLALVPTGYSPLR